MPKFPVVLTIECDDQAQANQVQKSLTELAGINGGQGLLNLKKELDGSLVARTMVHKIIKRKA